MTSVLVVEDESQLLRALALALQRAGHDVLTASTGEPGLELVATRLPDLIVLDLGLPDMAGLDFIRRVRVWSDVPLIVLSGYGDLSSKLDALEAGADDYVTKPFALDELEARIKALLRRMNLGAIGQPVLNYGELEIDVLRSRVSLAGTAVHLTKTEWRLLQAFASNPGKLLTHQWLLRQVWGASYASETGYVRVYVRQLRRKLGDDASSPTYIASETGAGYRWIAEPEASARAPARIKQTGPPTAPRASA
jgi:two-component system KDP operon response regulator KdpE